MNDVTHILSVIDHGNSAAADELLTLVYQVLPKLAAAKLSREASAHTLQPTVLVHEAYLRIIADQPQQGNGRGHFFADAAQTMQRMLIERARRKRSQKRGGDFRRVELDAASAATENRTDKLLPLDEALTRLEEFWSVKAKLVKLRYFPGLTIPEAAQTLGVSRATADRYWSFSRAWLHSQLNVEWPAKPRKV